VDNWTCLLSLFNIMAGDMNIQGVGTITEETEYRMFQEYLQYKRTIHPVYQQSASFLIKSPVNGLIAVDVIRENFTKLEYIDATWLAGKLFEKDLISQPLMKKINSTGNHLNDALLGIRL